MKMKSFSEHKLGLNKGAPRLWLEGRRPANAGFLPGARYSVEIRREKKAVVLRVVTDGHRVVAGKTRNGKEVPIMPRRVLVFRPSHVLKARVNGTTPEEGDDE